MWASAPTGCCSWEVESLEPKFELRFTPSHKMLAEAFRASVKSFMKVACTIVAGMALLPLLTSFVAEDPAEMLSLALEAASLWVIFYFVPDGIAWWQIRQDKKQNGGQRSQSHVLIGDAVEDTTGALKVSIPLEKITKVLHLKHSYLLLSGKSYIIALDPNGFTKGTFSEFKQHLREKCPNILIPE